MEASERRDKAREILNKIRQQKYASYRSFTFDIYSQPSDDERMRVGCVTVQAEDISHAQHLAGNEARSRFSGPLIVKLCSQPRIDDWDFNIGRRLRDEE